MAADPVDVIVLNGITFGNSSYIFSANVHLDAEVSVKQNADVESGPCILMFIGEENNIVLVTSPIE